MESEVEEEMCVGKRGYKKEEEIPTRFRRIGQHDTSVQTSPCKK